MSVNELMALSLLLCMTKPLCLPLHSSILTSALDQPLSKHGRHQFYGSLSDHPPDFFLKAVKSIYKDALRPECLPGSHLTEK